MALAKKLPSQLQRLYRVLSTGLFPSCFYIYNISISLSIIYSVSTGATEVTFDPASLLAPAPNVAERRARNKALVFEASGFVTVAPFFAIPSWWRRFMYVVLTMRGLQLYCYVCSQTDENGIAYPTYENIKADLNISNRTTIAKAISELIDKGFLLRARLPVLDRFRHRRNVFQRPSVQYTLWTLLIKGYIDGDLRPTIPKPTLAATRRDNPARNAGGIRKALHALIGDEAYVRYSRATGTDKVTVLAQRLNELIVDARIAFANSQLTATPSPKTETLPTLSFDEPVPF